MGKKSIKPCGKVLLVDLASQSSLIWLDTRDSGTKYEDRSRIQGCPYQTGGGTLLVQVNTLLDYISKGLDAYTTHYYIGILFQSNA